MQFFCVPIWQGLMDFDRWTPGSEPLVPELGLRCPQDCGLCAEHESGSCCVLLEVTHRYNLRCRFCFADGGAADSDPDPDTLRGAIRDIERLHRCTLHVYDEGKIKPFCAKYLTPMPPR